MRIPISALAGAALFAAALLLPHAAAAEGARDLDLGPMKGGSCPVTAERSEARAQAIARVEEQLRAASGAAASGDVTVLNGRGYRYDGDRVPSIAHELAVLEMELQRARAAAKPQPAPAQ